MDRRNFLKVICAGAATFFLSGCGLAAVNDEKNSDGKVQAKNISEGKSMKIVVINSSPHADRESTSKYLAQKFIEGAKSSGHEIFTFDAANEKTNPCRGCDHCGMDGDCIFNDDIANKLMPAMLEADLLVLVTPLYYFGFSAQMKTIIDRFYSRTGRLHGKRRRKPLALAMGMKAALSSFLDFYIFKCYTFIIGQTVVATALRHPIFGNINAASNLQGCSQSAVRGGVS